MNKACKQCSSDFEVADVDLEFHQRVSPIINDEKLGIPPPALCPKCRQQRRLCWRNEKDLYRRECSLCRKSCLSIYREKNPFPVYCLDCWWSDKWEPKKYGREFDFKRPFFEQFKDLQNTVPRMMVLQSQNENSEYTANVSHLKDCYMLFSSDFNRDCYYGVWIENSQNCIDNLMINKCQLAHEAVFSDNIHDCTYVIHSSQCSDSAFLLDCKNCSQCFMCYGLRNKKYCIANKQYAKEEYLEQINSQPLSSYKNYEKFKKHYLEMIKNAPYLYMWRNGRVENSTGDFLIDVKNCEECYEVVEGWDLKYVDGGYKVKDAYDCSYVHGELGYENCECFFMPMKSAFNLNTYYGNDIYYSDMCMNNNSYLFGCISLKKSKYCILNKQYTHEEYNLLLKKIIRHMRDTGEYGEFFPGSFSLFHYNETNAQEFFPLTEIEALSLGFTWMKKVKKDCTSQSYEIPDDISNVSEDILNNILSCGQCRKNYKIISQEYKLLRKMQLPIPRLCFECRHGQRNSYRKERKLYDRKCSKCSTNLKTNYSPEGSEQIYCEKCYLEEVY